MKFNGIYNDLISGKEKLALVGLGYVGMPIAVEFAKHVPVIGLTSMKYGSMNIKMVLMPPMRSGMQFRIRR